MHAEIIAVGSELTSGASLDTNSQWLSRRLGDVGITVGRHTAVADELDEIVVVLREAAARSDVLIVTGGLGPTLDDLTRQALAALAGVELERHEPSLGFLREFFARRKRPMPERNLIQAMFPEGSEPIPNTRGTAPGIWLEHRVPGRDTPCRIAALPGVPSEMKVMFDAQVLPRLAGSGRTIVRHEVHCFGAGESAVEELLGDLTARGRDPEVGITAHEATITLRIAAGGASLDECGAKVAATVALIRERLGQLVYGEQGERLEQAVVRMLAERGLTLCTAEAGTGGLLAQWLTQVRAGNVGAAPVYLGGVVLPGHEAGRRLLELPADLRASAGPSGRDEAAVIAAGCRQRLAADLALAISGWAEVDPDDRQAAPPVAFVALAGEGLLEVEEHPLLADPAISRARLAKAALNLLRLRLHRTSA